MNAAMIDGSFSERFEANRRYVVDEKGCIQCRFTDAGYFLQHWGVHFRTNRGMCGKPEISKEPCKTRTGEMLHVWYWRYAEVDAAQYAKLSPRQTDIETNRQKKRGDK